MADSVRKRIIKRIQTVLTDGLGVPVKLGPLMDVNHTKKHSVAIVPQNEKYTDSFPYQERALQLAIEYRVTINAKEAAPLEQLEDMLAKIEMLVIANKQWEDPTEDDRPLAFETSLGDNETDLYSYGDKSAAGVLIFTVKYRHAHEDVRSLDPDA